MGSSLAGAATGPHVDGGKVDRTALKAWRDARREGLPWGKQPPRALVHLVERSSQMSGTDDVAATGECLELMYLLQMNFLVYYIVPRCWSVAAVRSSTEGQSALTV